MAKKALLLGRTPFVLDEVRAQLEVGGVELFAGTSLPEVKSVFEQETIDVVIMGAGLPLDVRLQIVEHVFTVSSATTVHMKDRASGQAGMLPFADGILKGLAG